MIFITIFKVLLLLLVAASCLAAPAKRSSNKTSTTPPPRSRLTATTLSSLRVVRQATKSPLKGLAIPTAGVVYENETVAATTATSSTKNIEETTQVSLFPIDMTRKRVKESTSDSISTTSLPSTRSSETMTSTARQGALEVEEVSVRLTDSPTSDTTSTSRTQSSRPTTPPSNTPHGNLGNTSTSPPLAVDKQSPSAMSDGNASLSSSPQGNANDSSKDENDSIWKRTESEIAKASASQASNNTGSPSPSEQENNSIEDNWCALEGSLACESTLRCSGFGEIDCAFERIAVFSKATSSGLLQAPALAFPTRTPSNATHNGMPFSGPAAAAGIVSRCKLSPSLRCFGETSKCTGRATCRAAKHERQEANANLIIGPLSYWEVVIIAGFASIGGIVLIAVCTSIYISYSKLKVRPEISDPSANGHI